MPIGQQQISFALYSYVVPSVSRFFVVNLYYLRNDTFTSSYLASTFLLEQAMCQVGQTAQTRTTHQDHIGFTDNANQVNTLVQYRKA